jgi:hypothetical protein
MELNKYMININKAILEVMKEVENIEKGLSVGTGGSSYKAVSDGDVRNALRKAMLKAELVIVPTSVNAKMQIDRWEEETQYGKKMKQSVLTDAHTKYLLIHSSGESVELAGYGQGVDSQDKSAGKATTYALKNVLLDTFLITKGEAEDTDSVHSNDLPVPKKKLTKNEIEDSSEPFI